MFFSFFSFFSGKGKLAKLCFNKQNVEPDAAKSSSTKNYSSHKKKLEHCSKKKKKPEPYPEYSIPLSLSPLCLVVSAFQSWHAHSGELNSPRIFPYSRRSFSSKSSNQTVTSPQPPITLTEQTQSYCVPEYIGNILQNCSRNIPLESQSV